MAFETGTITDLSDANSIADPVVLVSAAAVKNPVFLGRFWNHMENLTKVNQTVSSISIHDPKQLVMVQLVQTGQTLLRLQDCL